MAVYLDTRGRSTLGIGICDRCSRKFSLDELRPDPNFPGLRVCRDDADQFDPYRLAPRQTENIALRHPRPDVSLATDPEGVITEDGDYFLINETSDEYYLF